MDWVRAAAERLVRAERELRQAQDALRGQHDGAKIRYAEAIRELEKAQSFVTRMTRMDHRELNDGEGLFG